MFIHVRLLNGLPTPLWYTVPASLQKNSLTGLIVQVPVRNRIVPALVIEEYAYKPYNLAFECKDIHDIEQLPPDEHYLPFLKVLGTYYQQDSLHFIKRIHHFLAHKKEELSIQKQRSCSSDNEKNNTPTIFLTDEQQKVCDFLVPKIDVQKYTPTVLHGVTGSGKTEIYKKLFLHALSLNKSALLLLPEVTLAISFEQRLQKEMPNVPIFGFHSGKTPKEKTALWNNLKQSIPMIIIGVHLPILLPIANLGVIVVDEEHETGYQEKKHPKINSKEIAIMRAQQANIPILLGSATPSISTLYNVKTKQWHFFQLKKRFSGTLPTIKVIQLPEDKKRKNFWISSELETAIKDRLHKKEQIIIFINRRGFSFFVQCKSCTFIFSCTSCSVSLTLHEHDDLLCHYCGIMQILPNQCPGCKAEAHHFLKKGIGTQKVVTLLQKMFPQANIARADLDTTAKKKLWQKTIADMHSGAIDILVGTQTITKGFHFPLVTLVGVLWADLQLNFPTYNAAETALQQLIQVSGRAGRNHDSSLVVIQTMADHELFKHLNEIDYLQFYAHEIAARIECGYPPSKRLVELELKHINEKTVHKDAHHIVTLLYDYANNNNIDIQILGPVQPPVSKIKDIHSIKIYLKATRFVDIVMLYKTINKKIYASSIYFTANPVN